jgi:hypothetical protein
VDWIKLGHIKSSQQALVVTVVVTLLLPLRGGEFIDQLSDYQLLMEYSDP